MDLTIVIAFIAIVLFLACPSRALTRSLKLLDRRAVAIEKRVPDLEDELAKYRGLSHEPAVG